MIVILRDVSTINGYLPEILMFLLLLCKHGQFELGMLVLSHFLTLIYGIKLIHEIIYDVNYKICF